MLSEHRESKESRDSLDIINDAIIRNTFLGIPQNTASEETKETKEEDGVQCCSDDCLKWWFFHSSFQIPSKTDIKEDLLNQRKRVYCCDLCSECLEIKLLNYCASNECIKEHCSDCFYNGCQLSCCCFTFILSSK